MKCSECMKAKVHHNIEHIYIYIVFFMFVLNVHAFAFTQIASNRCTTITSNIEQASSVNSLPHDRHKKHPIRTQFFYLFSFLFRVRFSRGPPGILFHGQCEAKQPENITNINIWIWIFNSISIEIKISVALIFIRLFRNINIAHTVAHLRRFQRPNVNGPYILTHWHVIWIPN